MAKTLPAETRNFKTPAASPGLLLENRSIICKSLLYFLAAVFWKDTGTVVCIPQ